MPEKPGRPRIYTGQDAPLKAKTYRGHDWHFRWVKRLGDGNDSEGFRLAVEDSYELRNGVAKSPERKRQK